MTGIKITIAITVDEKDFGNTMCEVNRIGKKYNGEVLVEDMEQLDM